jgi:hypothetical protein
MDAVDVRSILFCDERRHQFKMVPYGGELVSNDSAFNFCSILCIFTTRIIFFCVLPPMVNLLCSESTRRFALGKANIGHWRDDTQASTCGLPIIAS